MSWYNHLRLRLQVLQIYYSDYRRYRRHSAYYHPESREALELRITVLYHSLEKGFLHTGEGFRPRFGRDKVIRLLDLLERRRTAGRRESSHVIAAEEILSAYYRYHEERGVDLSDYFPREAFDRLRHHATRTVTELDPKKVETGRRAPFGTFAHSRHSIRHFTEQPVTEEVLRPVIELANTAPSACNRQETQVHLISDESTVGEILSLQGGFAGEITGIHQLLLVTVDLRYTLMEGMDRYQPYIDGGIYLLNLLYALHYHGIDACAGNASLLPRDEGRILQLAQARSSEALIAVVPIGYAAAPILTTLSARRPAEETLTTTPCNTTPL